MGAMQLVCGVEERPVRHCKGNEWRDLGVLSTGILLRIEFVFAVPTVYSVGSIPLCSFWRKPKMAVGPRLQTNSYCC